MGSPGMRTETWVSVCHRGCPHVTLDSMTRHRGHGEGETAAGRAGGWCGEMRGGVCGCASLHRAPTSIRQA